MWYLNVNNVPYLNCQKYFKINLFSCCRNLSLSFQDQLKSCRVCLCLKVSVKGVVCVSPIILCTDCYVSWYGATQTNKLLHLPYLHLPSHSHTHSNQYQGWYIWDILKETLSKTVRHNTCETFYVWILLYRPSAPWARQCCAWFSGCDMKGDDKCAPPSLDLSHIAHFTRNYNWEWERNMLLNFR